MHPKPTGSTRKQIRLKSAQVLRKTFDTITVPFWIVDLGDRTFATFGYLPGSTNFPAGTSVVGPTIQNSFPFQQGLNQLYVDLSNGGTQPLFEGRIASVRRRLSSSKQQAVIRDVTITFDPMAQDNSNFRQAFCSYTKAYDLLLAGNIRFDSQPFATVIPIGADIKVVGGIRSYRTTSGLGAPQNEMHISPVNGATHRNAGVAIEIVIPPAGQLGASLNISSVSLNEGLPYTRGPFTLGYFWSGQITTTIELLTNIGTLAGPYYYADNKKCQPGLQIGFMIGSDGSPWMGTQRYEPARPQCPVSLDPNIQPWYTKPTPPPISK